MVDDADCIPFGADDSCIQIHEHGIRLSGGSVGNGFRKAQVWCYSCKLRAARFCYNQQELHNPQISTKPHTWCIQKLQRQHTSIHPFCNEMNSHNVNESL